MIYINNSDVSRALFMEDAITALRLGFSEWTAKRSKNGLRQRIAAGGRTLNVMSAIHGEGGVFGVKAYFPNGENIGGHTLLYADDGKLLAVIEADILGRLRTGAVSAIATDLLAAPDARLLAVIGSGIQAFAQVSAVKSVRPIGQVVVYSPTAAKCCAFCKKIESELGVAARDAPSAETCVEGAGIVVTATKSPHPVLRREWLADGVHINAIGANALARRELDDETVLSAEIRVVDDRAQAMIEAAEYASLVQAGKLVWDDIVELGTLVATGELYKPRRLSVFKSLGIAFTDVVLGKRVFEAMPAQG